ncbi:MAG: hypothetical protein K2R93_09920 [Gemmatimonadaceae bacterium]|nr:hypothetical protein [Gemmatimonadaceae bacterium]
MGSHITTPRLALLSGITAATLLAACAKAPASAPPPPAPAPEAPVAPATAADGLSPVFHEAFAKADARARAITYWMQCVATVARLRAGGTFGAAASAPKALYCERTSDGLPVGGVYDIDSSYRTVRRLSVVRLDGARAKYTDALDTARLARGAKLAREVSKLVTPVWTRKAHPFSVVPIVVNDTVEAWVMPRPSKARSFVTGGDVGYAAGADGAPVVLEDRTATWTQLTLPATGALTIYSSVKDVAAVADLVTARYQHDLAREVTVSTPAATSTLVAGLDSTTGARVVWKHTPRK